MQVLKTCVCLIKSGNAILRYNGFVGLLHSNAVEIKFLIFWAFIVCFEISTKAQVFQDYQEAKLIMNSEPKFFKILSSSFLKLSKER